MIKRRRFSGGVAVVNPTGCTQTVSLGGVYYPSDSRTGDFFPYRAAVSSVEIRSRSGSVLVGSGKACAAIPEIYCWQGKHGEVHVEWEPIHGASSYSVYRTVDKGGQAEDELLAVVDDTEYAVLSIEDAEAYDYRVAAIDEIGCEGQPSCPAAVVTQLGSDPSLSSLMQVWDGAVTLEDEEDERAGRGSESGFGARAEAAVTALWPCYPNPACDGTTISFRIADDGRSDEYESVHLSVYDVAGRKVRTLVEAALPVGEHSVNWDVRGRRGARVASGCYFAVLRVGDETRMGKILVTD